MSFRTSSLLLTANLAGCTAWQRENRGSIGIDQDQKHIVCNVHDRAISIKSGGATMYPGSSCYRFKSPLFQRGHKLHFAWLLLCLAWGLTAWPAWAQTPDPTPNTYVDWPVPNLTGWNDINARTVSTDDHAGRGTHLRRARSLESQGEFEITYIYPDQATHDADVDGSGAGSVAFLSFDLDDGSGRAPGIQAVTDDLAFPTHNCIMASGEREADAFEGSVVPKTCSDDQGSSKRFFLEVTEADTPVDLVFDTGVKIIRYKGVRDPEEDDGAALDAFRDEHGIGRIYRVLAKFLNLTGKRIVSLRWELGTGVGEEFQPLQFDTDGLGFEMRTSVSREFFDGSTGAPDRPVWNPENFASLSPKLFDDGVRPRFDPGFFDHASAGLNPPQLTGGSDQSQFIDSGTAIRDGIVGAMTLNHFDIPYNQGFGAVPPLVGNVFGYLLPFDKAPDVISRYDDGEPGSESDAVMAWWDGHDWRYGLAGDPDLGVGPYGLVPETQLLQWAALPLGLDPSLMGDPARFDSELSDDLANLNSDVYVHLGEGILTNTSGEGQPKYESITLRLVAKSVDSLGLGEIPGSEDPDWVEHGNEAPPLHDYMPLTGVPVAINDLAVTMQDQAVDIDILANDLLDGSLLDPSLATVTIQSSPSHGALVVDADPEVPIEYTPTAGFSGTDTFTYTVTVAGEESNEATVRITVTPAPVLDAPVAHNDSVVTFESIPVSIDVLANDTLSGNPIPEGATLEVVDQPVNGIATATVEGDRIVYDPKTTPRGTIDVFTYQVTVDGKTSNLALVMVRVDELDDVIFADGFE